MKRSMIMKKILLAILSLVLCFSLCSCCCVSLFNKEKEPQSVNSVGDTEASKSVSENTSKPQGEDKTEVSKDPEPVDPYPEATSFIKEGKYAEAYAVLFAAKEDEEAAKRLESFVWRCTEAETYHSEGGTSRYTYIYDEKGNIGREVCNADDYESITTYRYDEEGRLEEMRVTSSYENYKIEYDYNENGLLSIETRYEDGESVTDNTKTLYSYDEQNRLIRVGKLWKAIYTELYTVTYDSQGNMSERIYADGDSTKYFYDESGVLVKQQSVLSGETKCPFVYTYDENGNLLSYLHEEEPGCKCIYYYSEARYTYDIYGNMLTADYIEGTTNYITYVCFYIGEETE